MKYYGGCDVGSTYTKAVILDETGKMVANTTIRSKINSEQSAIMAMDEPATTRPSAAEVLCFGATSTASGLTTDQKIACEQATPRRDARRIQ